VKIWRNEDVDYLRALYGSAPSWQTADYIPIGDVYLNSQSCYLRVEAYQDDLGETRYWRRISRALVAAMCSASLDREARELLGVRDEDLDPADDR
jgi:hypothetical protein